MAIIARVYAQKMQMMGEQLAEAHYKEVPYGQAKLALDMDYQKYQLLEDSGYLLILAALEQNKVVGYIVVVTNPMLHHKDKYMAITDSFYVDPAYRNSGIFKELLEEAARLCKEAGVVSFRVGVNMNNPAPEKILQQLGYREAERLYEVEF